MFIGNLLPKSCEGKKFISKSFTQLWYFTLKWCRGWHHLLLFFHSVRVSTTDKVRLIPSTKQGSHIVVSGRLCKTIMLFFLCPILLGCKYAGIFFRTTYNPQPTTVLVGVVRWPELCNTFLIANNWASC